LNTPPVDYANVDRTPPLMLRTRCGESPWPTARRARMAVHSVPADCSP
jgi:hypothetical protein